MAIQYDNNFVSLNTASASNVDVQVSNGKLEDSVGNSIYFGNKPSGDAAYRGINDLYVDRVTDDSLSGNLNVDGNSNLQVGSTNVTLTDPSGRRAITQVGNNGNESGDVKTDGGGNIILEYTETTTTTDTTREASTITSQSDFPVQQVSDPPSDASNVFMSGAVKVKSDSSYDSSDCFTVDVLFDRDDDLTAEREETITDCGGDSSNTNVRDTNLDTGKKRVSVGNPDATTATGFDQSTAAIVWEIEETTTTTNETLINVY